MPYQPTRSLPARSIVGAISLATFSLMGLAPAAGHAESSGELKLDLTCPGSGNVAQSQTAYTNVYDPKTKSYKQATTTTAGKKPFSGTVQVELSGAFARVKLPKDMVPLIGGGNGWYTVSELFENDREITGILEINMFNKPNLRIDRSSGAITLSGGLSDFSGRCDAYDRNAPKRF